MSIYKKIIKFLTFSSSFLFYFFCLFMYAQDNTINLLSIKEGKKFNFFEYYDSTFKFIVNPILGVSFENLFGHQQNTTSWGFLIKGNHQSGLKFFFSFNDNIVYNYDYYNKIDFLNKQGRILTRNSKNRSEFSETNGAVTFENQWVKIGLIKDNITFGEGKNSQLILSNRSPSFPALTLNLTLSDWFNVYLLHGWLISGIIDSNKSYYTSTFKRVVEHEKYFALHSFDFNFFNKIKIRIGETIVYSDRGPYLGYMLPFVLFRSIDHMFTYGSDDSGNNGSLFFDGNVNIDKNVKFYGSLFIDELSFSKLLRGDNDRNQLGYLFGMNAKDVLLKNLEIYCEYTKILPWVYSNWIPAQNYTNNRFYMGHYIGQNSDQIFSEISYKISPEINVKFSADYTRNGGNSDIINQYTPPGESFLYGYKRKILRIGGEINFEYFDNIYVNFEYDFYNVKDEDPLRTPEWQLGNNHFVSLRLFYGLNR